MILDIYAYGHPVLKKKAQDIDVTDKDLPLLIEDMYETMYNAQGVGLAAPQIGRSERLFIVDTQQLVDENSEPKVPIEGIKMAFINAQVTQLHGDTWSYEEGCLSIPGVNGDVYRQVGVTIKWTDLEGKEHERLFEGLEARVILHEYDHIEGKLFTEYLNPLKLRL